MAKLDKLLSIRSRIIGDFENHFNEARKFSGDSKTNAVSFRSIAIDKTYKEFADLIEELEKMSVYHSLDNITEVITKNRKIQDQYLEIKIFLSDFLPTEESMLNSSFFPSVPRQYDIATETLMNHKQSSIKLPHIQLCPFDGKYEEWPTFKDTFLSLMRKYNGDDIEKLTHLKNYLRGDARQVIQHLNLSNGNYSVAWELLKNQFENKNAIIEAHLSNLFGIPQISHNSSSSIRYALATTRSCLSAIENLNISTNTWDTIMVFLLKDKLNSELRNKWEEDRKGSHEPAVLRLFLEFLETRLKIVLSIPRKKIIETVPKSKAFMNINDEVITDSIDGHDEDHSSENDESEGQCLFSRKEKCGACDGPHRVFLCPKLTNVETALQIVKNRKLCFNCLYNHETSACTSRFTCKICKEKHNTLLHNALGSKSIDNNDHVMHIHAQPERALLVTAIIPVLTEQGDWTLLRALIDQGSTSNVISEQGAQLVQCLRKRISPVPILGLDNVQTGTIEYKTELIIGSLYDNKFQLPISAYIGREITTIRPMSKQMIKKWSHVTDLQLADTGDVNNSAIDILIGLRTFGKLLENGLIKGQDQEPIAQKTKLGWVLSGAYIEEPEEPIRLHMNLTHEISEQMKKFWEIEEVRDIHCLSPDDKECEKIFNQTITRHQDGRLIVRLPFKMDSSSDSFLGESITSAKRRFFQLERRFARNPDLKKEYMKGVHEYLQLGHAKKVDMSQAYHIIPHHAVVKESSLTTKLRIVFDASAKTSNGFSLNDRLYIGPLILQELWAVMIRWRLGKFALNSDIEKMYRQFWIHQDDTKFQQVLWRDNPKQPLELYELQTVTFGTSPAPFLAIRCLHYIADLVKENHPNLEKSIKQCFYVDDYFESFDTLEEAIERKKELTDTFQDFGLNLRKWNSNVKDAQENEHLIQIRTTTDNTTSTLGMQWNTTTDFLSFKVNLKKEPNKITKRVVFSETLSLFDPLGFLAPMIMRAKTFMQQLWIGTFDWDDELPLNLQQDWQAIKTTLQLCSKINVPRWAGFTKKHNNVSLVGFCDASEKAYAAVIYLRTEQLNGHVDVYLLTAKTKVSPMKTMTIPRLELCAALLLANLMEKLVKTLNIPNLDIFAWTDSAITLAWINTPAYQLKTFVSHRVAEIQSKIPAESWKYITSVENPADCATRVHFSNEIISLTKWWNGPLFLLEKPESWPKIPEHMIRTKNVPEMKLKVLYQSEKVTENSILTRFSSLKKLFHVTAYCLRWLKKYKHHRKRAIISQEEIENAKYLWIQHEQNAFYKVEIEQIKAKKQIHNKSSLLALTPYLDQKEILRVHGRIQHAKLSLERKHPIILSPESHLSTLIIQKAHIDVLHGGIQTTTRKLRDEFWVIRSRILIKKLINKCMICFRERCRPAKQQMGDLLPPQVQPNRPFSHTGVDFAGYFEIKSSTLRNAKIVKCYVALFICLTTKAIHLELAHDLSTQAFIAVLNRFISRRGIPTNIYSDRGTNFIGTANELPNLWYIEQSNESKLIQQECINKAISWHFNPARASHFGGLWEAGVKSMKTHLHCILKNSKLTYEEFNTLIIQIEACLNSRPLCPLSQDPDDLEVLTPGHFLIGQALITAPHPDMKHIPMNRLSRFQYLQHLLQNFWRQWSNEYLSRLQNRPKWKKQFPNLSVGQLVLIKEDGIPPSKWILGRITKTYPGKDGLIRCVEVKCKESKLSRPIHKLCPLPIEDKPNNDEHSMITQMLIPREDVMVRHT